MSVDKQLTTLILNNNETLNDRDIGKLELPAKSVNNTSLKLKYTIVVSNTGEIDGSCTLNELIPSGFKMEKSLNKDWDVNGNTAKLQIENLKPGDYMSVPVILTWNKSTDNFGTFKNTVKLTDINNEANFKDINSNDNEDSAEFILGIKTGFELNVFTILILLEIFTVAIIITTKRINFN